MKTNWETGIDMTPLTRRTIFIALCICMAPPAWGQQYLLYTPQPVSSGHKVAAKDGILVQEIEIQKGDTLYALSRKFSGRGMYYPQILLFNSIKNPNLIYPGNILKIPVAQKEAGDADRIDAKPAGATPKLQASGDMKPSAKAKQRPTVQHSATASSPVSTPSTELSLSDLKAGDSGKNKVSRTKKKAAIHAKKNQPYTLPAEKTVSDPSPAVHKSAAVDIPAADAAGGQKLFEAAVKAYRQNDCRTALELLDRYLADNSESPLAADAQLYKAECYLKLSAQ
jgi:LysM repeat protein